MEWLDYFASFLVSDENVDGAEVAFREGEMVEYNSASRGDWIPAQVRLRHPDGTYDLDCKAGVPAERVRSIARACPHTGYEIGAIVEYHSESQGGWIAAQILRYHPSTGRFDLDCKPGVPANKLRPRSKTLLTVTRNTSGDGDFGGLRKDAQEASRGGKGIGGLIPAPPKEAQEPPQLLPLASDLVSGADGSDRCRLSLERLACELTSAAPQETSARTPSQEASAPEPPGQVSWAAVSVLGDGDEAAAQGSSTRPAPASRRNDCSVQAGASRRPAPAQAAEDGSMGRLAHGGPAQLVRISRGSKSGDWHFELSEEGLRALEAYGQRRVSVCTVCGPYRTGKSYLLNLFLGQASQHFRIGSTTRACTEGLWMWGADKPSERVGPDEIGEDAVIFMDCEGFGSTEADRTRDAKLMSLCLVISSVLMLNTKGVLSENIFNALAMFGRLAERIGEGPGATCRPALLWVLRDFVLELRDSASGKELRPDEYLEQALQAGPLEGMDSERCQAALEVRQSLKSLFPRRHCATLVTPIVDEEKLTNLGDIPYSELRPEFRRNFEALQAQALGLAHENPGLCAGQPITGVGLAALLRRLVEALNRDQAMCVSTAWDSMQHEACHSLSLELQTSAVAELQKVIDVGAPMPVQGGRPLPLRDDELARCLKDYRFALKEQWLARSIGDDAVREEYWLELEEALHTEAQRLTWHNVSLAERSLAAAGAAWAAWLSEEGTTSDTDPRSEALQELIERGVPMQPAVRAVCEAFDATKTARARLGARIAALDDEILEKGAAHQRRVAELLEKASAQEQKVTESEATIAELRDALARASARGAEDAPPECPGGHELRRKACMGRAPRRKRCASCGTKLLKGMHRFSCKDCGYHLCEPCMVRR